MVLFLFCDISAINFFFKKKEIPSNKRKSMQINIEKIGYQIEKWHEYLNNYKPRTWILKACISIANQPDQLNLINDDTELDEYQLAFKKLIYSLKKNAAKKFTSSKIGFFENVTCILNVLEAIMTRCGKMVDEYVYLGHWQQVSMNILYEKTKDEITKIQIQIYYCDIYTKI
ncbi:hypothetical protein TTHERM_00753350 (macronuclear) [Tetrahymena thermophila SB210]|uniref:Uncharacterized protein n=1 Tax=Tetrahymena thermophila (strain SB210) TaxID=312017 RepID=Q23NI5_TETTS|nr:hypothetical protein TTHERM_00753350 [Tetrahymena thermophila SB210]EAR98089.2 hypothetical protein TTHERM_00753350 [Tetrahymena thermophila SB210]|eukprot:XP_001018334.2 hypothetical protein TTHERM_00753350 [Tetrahymena thermophila SB210]